MAHRVVTITG